MNFKIIYRLTFVISLLAVIALIIDFGFPNSPRVERFFTLFYDITFFVGIVSTLLRYVRVLKGHKPKISILVFDFLSVFFFATMLVRSVIIHDSIFALGIILVFIREFSSIRIIFKRKILNPAQIFVSSFLFIVILGSFLLMLPNATTKEITYVDALFTSTSAVCVTGLAVLDTGNDFTLLGQGILLALIQIGGLGIMTFASYFSFFFKGVSSFENQLMIGEISSSERLSDVFATIKKILLVTFSVEILGAFLIYISMKPGVFTEFDDKVYFSVFHSVSAFCNAGFSTLSNSLYQEGFRVNYVFHTIVAFLVIFGGLGFPIMFNVVKYIRYQIYKYIGKYFYKKHVSYKPWVLSLSTRIILRTTFILLILGMVLYFIFEQDHTLKGHGVLGQLSLSFFGAVTPRTAGFNAVDMTGLSLPTIMIYFLLMWIGASPASTGGGIKTSTFAIAILNFWSIIRGKERVELYRREITDNSIRRSYAIIFLSLLAIGLTIFGLAAFEKDKELLDLAFESFSAFSTVGLSLGITASLTVGSKYLLILAMFIGRVSMLSLLIALVKKDKFRNYRYPKEDILIN